MSNIIFTLIGVLCILLLFEIFGELDWLHGSPYGSLPEWPSWMCKILTNHKMKLHYADYNVDIKGVRCFCGKNFQDEIL